MKIIEIQVNLAALEVSAVPDKKKKSKASTPSAVAAVFAPPPAMIADDLLAFNAARIAAAFGLDKQGITAEGLVAGVLAFETPHKGLVM